MPIFLSWLISPKLDGLLEGADTKFQSDKKAWMEHLISERDKRLAEIADKEKAEKEKQKFIKTCKDLGLDTSGYENEK